jgi:hypothetical protein
MRIRLVTLFTALVLLAPPGAALAQDGNPFNGLPPAQPTPAPTATPASSSSADAVGRTTLYLIGAALVVAFVGIGWWISRDARGSLPEDKRREALREDGPHKHERQAKAKARAKGRAQRQARKRARARNARR